MHVPGIFIIVKAILTIFQVSMLVTSITPKTLAIVYSKPTVWGTCKHTHMHIHTHTHTHTRTHTHTHTHTRTLVHASGYPRIPRPVPYMEYSQLAQVLLSDDPCLCLLQWLRHDGSLKHPHLCVFIQICTLEHPHLALCSLSFQYGFLGRWGSQPICLIVRTNGTSSHSTASTFDFTALIAISYSLHTMSTAVNVFCRSPLICH